MTSVGKCPTLDELILALNAIGNVEADMDTLRPEAKTFRVVLTFVRELCPNDWIEGQPKPTWLFEQLIEELYAWRTQRDREEQWVSKEEQMGSSIDTLMVHYHEELTKAFAAAPQTITTRMQIRTLSDTILRLKELKERREAGGVYSNTESRREKARKSWEEDEYEGPKREEEQRRQQHTRDWTYDSTSSTYSRKAYYVDPEEFRKFWEGINNAKNPQKPQSGNKKPWHAVLGVPAHANKKEITKAYRKLAAKYHPDRYKEVDGHERMAEINTACDEGLGGL